MINDVRGNLSILIVDDDRIDREAIKRYLRHPDTPVDFQEADSGKTGLEILRESRFDCVFLDYLLPDMDGISFLKQIYHSQYDITDSPIVILTGQGSESVMIEALRCGAQDYIVKDNISAASLSIAITKARELFELRRSRKALEDERQHARRLESIGQLTSGIAHDFNNLLTVIMGNARILQSKMKDLSLPPDLIKKAASIETASARGADLVRRLMMFSRQTPLAAAETDINQKIREAIDLLSHSLGSSVQISTRLGDRIPPALIDAAEFQNALINLCVNARDAMPEGGVISIETASMAVNHPDSSLPVDITPGKYVVIVVRDTGIGIAPDALQKIFEPFYSTKPIGQGTGLGLSTTYGFVRQSDGYISVQSKQGHGTTFRIFLPAANGKDR